MVPGSGWLLMKWLWRSDLGAVSFDHTSVVYMTMQPVYSSVFITRTVWWF